MLMDTRLLRTFTAVARLGSFSAAAEKLHLTQSAVSQQVAALEAELGATLLRRRPVEPTEAGERLLRHARSILLRLDAARLELRRLGDTEPGALVVGASPLAMSARVALELATVRRRHPHLEVTFRLVARPDLAEEVASGRVDVGLVDGIAAPTDPLGLPDLGMLTVAGVGEAPLAIVMPAGHPLARRAAVDLADVGDAPWIDAPSLGSLAGLRAAAGSGSFPVHLLYEGADVRPLLELVAAGHGLALLPRAAAAAAGVVAVAVHSPRLVHRVEVLHARGLDTAAAGLVAALAGTAARRA
ncbi:MAG TPA: LysR family transcriptional regulator [Candidatus Dormibacteraeota bacterium]|nr:LysR family transcriptional regulator [Candidatus Dormibacteraeota bacterium]